MKIHLRQIPAGDILHIEGEEDARPLQLEQAGGVAVSPLYYALDIGLSHKGLFATGRIGLRVRMQCVNCLTEFTQEIVVDPFAAQVELTGSELIDLTSILREDIHLVLPTHPKCDAEGSSKCPATYESTLSFKESQRAKVASAWDALDKLKH